MSGTAEFYYEDHAGLAGRFVTAQGAKALYAQHEGEDGFRGDLPTGFSYWGCRVDPPVAPGARVGTARVRVTPVAAAALPPDVLARLRAETDREAP